MDRPRIGKKKDSQGVIFVKMRVQRLVIILETTTTSAAAGEPKQTEPQTLLTLLKSMLT
jgi:hypothetical protein